MSCSLCGKKKAPYILKKDKKKIGLCYSCKEIAEQSFHGKNIPVVWVGEEDLSNMYDDDPEIMKGIKRLRPKDYKNIADIMSEWFWNNHNEWYNEAVHEAFNEHLRYKEEDKLRSMPKKNLPLMIGSLKYKENEKTLEKLLKGKVI